MRREVREAAKGILGRGRLLNVLELKGRRHVERLPRIHVFDDAVIAESRPQVHPAKLGLCDGHGQATETGDVQQREGDDANVGRDEKAAVRHVHGDAAGKAAVRLATRRANRLEQRLGVVGAGDGIRIEHDERA